MNILEFLDKEEKWAKGWFAFDNEGKRIDPGHHAAVQWCILGAAMRVYQDPFELDEAIRKLQADIGGPVNTWQDDPARTFQEVRDVLVRLDV